MPLYNYPQSSPGAPYGLNRWINGRFVMPGLPPEAQPKVGGKVVDTLTQQQGVTPKAAPPDYGVSGDGAGQGSGSNAASPATGPTATGNGMAGMGLGVNPSTAASAMGLAGITGPAMGPVGTLGGLMSLAQAHGLMGQPNLSLDSIAQGLASIAAQGFHANTMTNPAVNSPEFDAVVGDGFGIGPGMGMGGVDGTGSEAGITGTPGQEGIGAVGPGEGAASAAAADAAAAPGAGDPSATGDYFKGGIVRKPKPGAKNPPGPDDQYAALQSGERVLSRKEVGLLGGPAGINRLLKRRGLLG